MRVARAIIENWATSLTLDAAARHVAFSSQLYRRRALVAPNPCA